MGGLAGCSDEDEPDARIIIHFDAAPPDSPPGTPDAGEDVDAGEPDAP